MDWTGYTLFGIFLVLLNISLSWADNPCKSSRNWTPSLGVTHTLVSWKLNFVRLTFYCRPMGLRPRACPAMHIDRLRTGSHRAAGQV
jgi:hypothetical protein